mmetsp:Transcript_6471/g.8403  ORF Transcript_6471/g.8403 Transcript_6471/m.8403 type:complete len:418 (-) Transcript_6471:113-1366(-)|eukprot:CAMPEP_0198146746 /NCGR_PEP_ID=MMETSP1443-20131203/31197_1 /TAXON_ID=186043 /ORGANISM="Entomoneis sp., Strain CCMP2396" /LENGTH=417 /DNA_ID=CAMNT_0043810811 /DNA_START=40 /DNA_END=1293 /DNA_ORIENTATION=+
MKENDADMDMNGEGSEAHLLRGAEQMVQEKTASSAVLNKDAEDRVPRISSSELSIGRFCGKGGFCIVSDINQIALSKHTQPSLEYTGTDGWQGDDIVQDREFMASHYLRDNKHHRYVIKVLQESVKKDDLKYESSVVDLVIETRFLAVLRHPNIIKMRAVALTSPFEPGRKFFVILDKLYVILSDKLKTNWKRRLPKLRNRFTDFSGLKSLKATAFMVERLSVLYDLSLALVFLHSMNILYRDLKPDNIGFDVRGDVKIFDFGLAKEVEPERVQPDGTYRLTPDCGSLRYMAPEVALEKSYNEACDVYSFSLLIWQVLKVDTPFGDLYKSGEEFREKVAVKGARPKIDPKWPGELVDCMRLGWGEQIDKRPSMVHISQSLNKEINNQVGQERDASPLDRSDQSAVLLRSRASSRLKM